MDPDKLAERDRARRQRQLRNAKLQGFALIGCVLAGLAYAVAAYFKAPLKKAPEKEPPAPSRYAEMQPVEPPASAPGVEEPQAAAEDAKTTAAPDPDDANAVDRVRKPSTGLTRMNGEIGKPAVPMANVLASIGVTDSEKSRRPLPKVEEAKRVLDLLAKTSHLSGKLEHVIMKPGIELRMKEFYEIRQQKDPAAGEQMADFEIQMAGERYLDVVYQNPTRPAGTLRASFLRDEKGIVRLDWESFVGFTAMSMREFREKKPEDGVVMRVVASIDDYFNYEFVDAKRFLSVRLRNADGSDAVNGFCEQGGRVATAFAARLATATAADAAAAKDGSSGAATRTWAPIVVKVRFPPKPQSDHCVELMELMHGQWLAPAGLVE